MVRQKRREGDFVAIDLGDGCHAFGRVLPEPLIAFYDLRTTDAQPTPESLAQQPVLWRLWVANKAVESGRWRGFGHLPLTENLLEEPVFFKKDPITKATSLYQGTREWPATLEECEDLECAAVWDPQHVEDRLRDHFGGRPNKWVQMLRLG